MEPASKRRRGGQRQRLEKAENEDGGGHAGNSAVAFFLMSMFAWGHFSPQQVQEIAKCCLDDILKAKNEDCKFDDLEFLAKLGSGGAYANKMQGELMNRCQHMSKLPQPFHEHVKFKAPLGYKDQAFLLPHEMFAHIYHHYPSTWEKSILPSNAVLGTFWDAVQGHPQMVDHPITARLDYKEKAIPLGFHGDAVPITGIGKIWCKLMTMFSWTSLISTGSTRETMMWVWGVFNRLCIKDAAEGTMDTFFRILRWSFYWLYMGVWPDRPWNSDVKHLTCTFEYNVFFVL